MDSKNCFTISKNKTKAMHFVSIKKCMDPVFVIFKSDYDPIQFVMWLNFLVWFGIQNSHLNLISNISKRDVKIPEHHESPICHSLVRSKLDNDSIVFGSASNTSLAKLDPVHNKALHLSLGAFRSSPVASLYVEAHEPPIGNSQRKVSSTVHHQTKSQSRESN